tara:strand:+ start:3362 stop:3763 length:402 start_codon:yes stop_codon:yes gene_type:complete
MANFPSIAPSSRTYTPGRFPSTDFESLDGTKTHIRFGNKRVNATMTLGFSNLSDSEVESIIDNYVAVNSVWDEVNFTVDRGLKGVTSPSYRKEIIGHWTGLNWRYSAPPTVTSTFNGLSNVSCSFVACLDAPI